MRPVNFQLMHPSSLLQRTFQTAQRSPEQAENFLATLQLPESRHSLIGSDLRARRVGACNNPPIDVGEGIPGARRRYICIVSAVR